MSNCERLLYKDYIRAANTTTHWSARTELVNIFTVQSVISCLLEQIKFVFQWEYCGTCVVSLNRMHACNKYIWSQCSEFRNYQQHLNCLFVFLVLLSYFSGYGIMDSGSNQVIFSILYWGKKNGLTISAI